MRAPLPIVACLLLAIPAAGGCEDERDRSSEGARFSDPPAGDVLIDDGSLAPGCGNGILEPGEECDDGNVEAGDLCDPECRFSVPRNCGDHVVGRGEECDDGNVLPGDGCDEVCLTEICEPDHFLGELPMGDTVTQLVRLDEADDDQRGCKTGRDVVIAFTIAQDAVLRLTLGSTAAMGAGLYRASDGLCTSDLIGCQDAVPGEGLGVSELYRGLGAGDYLVVAEEGDFGAGGVGYVSLAALDPTHGCGNGVVNEGEVCDDGNRQPGDGCGLDCDTDESCGNDFLDEAAGEECDDGNRRDGDRCDSECATEPAICRVDEAIGDLTPGVRVDRTLEVVGARDDWLTECNEAGPEVVVSLNITRPGNLWVLGRPAGRHTLGLYRRGFLEDQCIATEGVCFTGNQGDGGEGGFIAWRRPAGEYLVMVEASSDDEDPGPLHLSLFVEGCQPDADLGMLPAEGDLQVSIDTTEGSDLHEAGCGSSGGFERVVAFQLDEPSSVEVAYQQAGDHVLGVMHESGGGCAEHPVTCQDPAGAEAGTFLLPRLEAGPYVIVVDAHGEGTEGLVALTIGRR